MISAIYMMGLWVSGAFLVGLVARNLGAKRRSGALLVLAFAALVYSSYKIGRFDGEGAYFDALRGELNPFLRGVSAESSATSKAAVKDFLLRADDIKLEPSDYLKDLRGARKLLEKEPNQTPEPTTLRVTPAADAPVAPRSVVAHL